MFNKFIGYRNICEASEVSSLKIEYASTKNIYHNIFKYIIIFTNNKNPKENKTLSNIYSAIENLKSHNCKIIPELFAFTAAKCLYDDDKNIIHIEDNELSLDLENQNNTNTLIFSRLGVSDTNNCEYIVKLLQDRGFLVLNPVQNAALANNKYDTACLLKKANLPQPNFCLMTKSILYNAEKYEENISKIYSKESDKDEFVLKILNGHGGIGVTLCVRKQLYSILQMIFAIDPEIEILIQRKENGDGGDIRVHVLSLRNQQIILGAMKRVKIKGDFRSNVSLGAIAEKIKLTPQQEDIALRAAKVSKLPWCAVDIMPLVKGSNPDIGDNVILELNASPGTAGISKVIGVNFINVLLSQLLDPSEFMLQQKIAGVQEKITINFTDEISNVYLAKLDTGNSTIASTVEVGKINWNKEKKKVSFSIKNTNLEFDVINISYPVSGGERPVIIVPEIQLGKRKLKNIFIALVEKRDRTTNVLLNTDILSKLGYIVDPINTHLLTEKIDKIKIL